MLKNTRGKYILIVDDVALMRRMITKMVSTLGLDTQEADSVEQAKEQIKKQLPSLILLDILMPKVNGLELCRWLRKNRMTQHIPVIACTSLQDRKYVQGALQAGVNDYLCKPLDKKILQERIKKHLGAEEALEAAVPGD